MNIKAKALDGGDITLEQGAITSLKTAVRGTVLLESDPAYDKSRTVWNAMIDRRPALIVQCIGTSDVIAAVKFARDTGIAVSIRGGGHNVAGLAVADGALMLDLSLMRGVLVDPEKRIAHAQAGCTLGDVDRETQLHGLAAVLGFVSNTGIAGLTLGGGFGYLTKRYGWASDNVRSIQVVTAEGSWFALVQEKSPSYSGHSGVAGAILASLRVSSMNFILLDPRSSAERLHGAVRTPKK